MESKQFESLRRRYRAAKARRTGYEAQWDEIEYYTGPLREEGNTFSSPSVTGSGQQKRKDLWDLTGIESREKLSSSMYQSIIPTSLRWFLASFRKSTLNRDTEARTWLDQESEDSWGDIQDSNFNTEMARFFQQITGPGNAFVAMEPLPPQIVDDTDDKGRPTVREEYAGVEFTFIPLEECFFERDRKGGVATFWRRKMWMAAEAVDFFEEHKLDVPTDIMEKYQAGSTEMIEFVYCVFQRKEIMKKYERRMRYPLAPDKRPWGCMWWREDKGEMLGEENGYYEKPIFYSPWSVTAGSQWGHGPGNIALPTVKYINARMEQVQSAGELALQPPMLISERAALGDLTVNFKPGTATIVGDVNGVKELHQQPRVDISIELIEGDRAQVRRVFHADELTMKDSPAMTAMEAQIRYELMNRLLGKTLSLLQENALGPIVLTIMQIRARMKAGAPMPKKVRAAGGVFNLDFQGPLARAQRTDEVAAIERGATFVGGLSQIWPEARAGMDPIKAIKLAFVRLGVPSELIPPDQKIEEAIKAMNQQSSAMAQAATDKDAAAAEKSRAEAGSKLGPAPGIRAAYPPLPPAPPLSPAGYPA